MEVVKNLAVVGLSDLLEIIAFQSQITEIHGTTGVDLDKREEKIARFMKSCLMAISSNGGKIEKENKFARSGIFSEQLDHAMLLHKSTHKLANPTYLFTSIGNSIGMTV